MVSGKIGIKDILPDSLGFQEFKETKEVQPRIEINPILRQITALSTE